MPNGLTPDHPMLGRLALPHELRPERAAASHRGRVSRRVDRRRARPRRRPRPPLRPAARHRQGDGPRDRGRPPADRHGPAQAFDEPEAVLNAALGHHGDVRRDTPYTLIVMAADAISAAPRRPPREPGALRQAAGRTRKLATRLRRRRAGLRHPGRPRGARDRQHEDDDRRSRREDLPRHRQEDREQMQYPGEIKVTVIRETRYTETAK